MNAMRDVAGTAPRPTLLWIRADESDTEVAAFAPVAGGIRILRADKANEALAALSHDPDRAAAVVVVESAVRGFEELCGLLSSMSPAPRVVVVYPRMRVLASVRHLPTMACGF